MVGNIIDKIIKQRVNEILSTKKEVELPSNFIETDNFGEVIDKLIILHIRTWMLEDTITKEMSNEDVGVIKRKIDVCFKYKRPQFISALNKLLESAVVKGNSTVDSENVKLYKSER